MWRCARLAAVTGMVAPIALLATACLLTLADWDFLRARGWSALRRTPVEWPSVLELGPHGSILVTAFVVCGALGIAFSGAFFSVAPNRAGRGAAVLAGLVSFALALEAFRPDRVPGTHSWHATIHDVAYPAIVFGGLAAAALAVPLCNVDGWRLLGRTSLVTLALVATGLALASADGVAQLARYVVLAGLLLWFEVAALTTVRRLRN